MKDYELRTALENVAKDIHAYDSNPITWLNWIVYLLKQLESQAMDVNPANQERYEEMVSNLKDAIYNRQHTGGW